MERTGRRKTTYLKDELLNKPESFSFFQVVRILKGLGDYGKQNGHDNGSNWEDISVKPTLSLGFPKSDVEKVETSDNKKFEITANILGLYGTCSPIPTFYTEELFDERSEGDSEIQDFLGVINQRLYEFLFRSWSKYSTLYNIVEADSRDYRKRLYSIFGLYEDKLREDIDDPRSLIKYAGLLSQAPESAVGLSTFLKNVMKVNVEILPFIKRKAKIPEDQQCRLGEDNSTLGEDAYTGELMEDSNSKFRICLGPFDSDEFRKYFPGTEESKQLTSLTNLYVKQPYEFDIEIKLKERSAKRINPGNSWCSLGLDTWLFDSDEPEAVSTIFSYSSTEH
ncbi:MAG: type VI secretion system baseplate subunit TssG [Desulfobacterales bacterium]|nr:type VI secretion system baseplate subunit TssG [Desulfobacterales bacterium]MCP4160449.1 type VI secretion system baseplate subunit TssG [Deltaproteobacteria bacterium]